MGVERGNAVGWDSPQSLYLLPYSSSYLYLRYLVLKLSGSTVSHVSQSAFSTQAATMAKNWQVSIPWNERGGQQMGQGPTSSTSAPDLQGAPGQSSHRYSLSCQKQREGKRNRDGSHTPTSPGQGVV